jgi:hypothetical protein
MPGQHPANPELNRATSPFPPSKAKKPEETEEARRMKKNTTFAAIAASVLAAFTIGLAAPAIAAPITGPSDDQVTVDNNQYPVNGQTPYGTYQNPHKSR